MPLLGIPRFQFVENVAHSGFPKMEGVSLGIIGRQPVQHLPLLKTTQKSTIVAMIIIAAVSFFLLHLELLSLPLETKK
jgi:hypothetical protein